MTETLIETGVVDVFVSGLARVEPMGPMTRFVFYVSQLGPGGNQWERAVALRLVIPTDMIATTMEQTICALGPSATMPAVAYSMPRIHG